MRKRTHVLSALLLGILFGTYLEWPAAHTAIAWRIVDVTVPIVLGSVLPDVDTEIGTHRKTLHNGLVLIGTFLFPVVFGNLEYVWMGVLLHYLEDMVGDTRGVAWFYPITPREFKTG